MTMRAKVALSGLLLVLVCCLFAVVYPRQLDSVEMQFTLKPVVGNYVEVLIDSIHFKGSGAGYAYGIESSTMQNEERMTVLTLLITITEGSKELGAVGLSFTAAAVEADNNLLVPVHFAFQLASGDRVEQVVEPGQTSRFRRPDAPQSSREAPADPADLSPERLVVEGSTCLASREYDVIWSGKRTAELPRQRLSDEQLERELGLSQENIAWLHIVLESWDSLSEHERQEALPKIRKMLKPEIDRLEEAIEEATPELRRELEEYFESLAAKIRRMPMRAEEFSRFEERQLMDVSRFAGDALFEQNVEMLEAVLEADPYLVNARGRNGLTSLHIAVRSGRKNIAEHLLAKGAEVNARDSLGLAPLHHAALQGQIEAAKFLLEQGADVEVRDKRGRTALHWAAARLDACMVQLLLDAGADAAAKNEDGLSPFERALQPGMVTLREPTIRVFLARAARSEIAAAVLSSDLRKVNSLLEASPVLVKARDVHGWTPLHLASWSGELNVVEFLLSNGANVEDTDQRGLTPLHLAAGRWHVEITKLLLSRGAEPEASARDGSAPLHWAAASENEEVVNLILAAGAAPDAKDMEGRTPLYWAAGQRDKRIVETLLANGADPNCRGPHGTTPLHQAGLRGPPGAVEALLVGGADANASDDHGRTVLHEAANRGERRVVELVLDSGVSINVTDKSGRTPLHEAATYNHPAVVGFLLAKRADPNFVDGHGYTPLHWASQEGYAEVVAMLASKVDDIDARAVRGMTPLHLGALGGHADVVRLLLANNAAVNPRDDNGWTPLKRALSRGQRKVVEVLREHGAIE